RRPARIAARRRRRPHRRVGARLQRALRLAWALSGRRAARRVAPRRLALPNRSPGGRTMRSKDVVARELEAVRRRSLDLLEPVPEPDQVRQHSPLMSPLVWDLAHVGNYEEQWLLRAVAGVPPTDPRYDDIYDAFRHPRRDRPQLPMLGPRQARGYIAGVRS